MNLKKALPLIVTLILTVSAYGQPGGKAFQFLDVTNSARIASLGGKAVAVYDGDLNMPYFNPSLLSADMDNHLVLNYVNYFAGVNYGYASYSRSYDKIGNFAAGIHYLNYGTFIAADETGAKSGEFHASEYAINLIYSRKIDSLLYIGANLKPIYSTLERYSAFAMALDAGITYHNPDKLFTASLVIRNFGSQLSAYYAEGDYEPLPFDIALGFSKGLAHSPFTFYIVADHLEKWDLTYQTNAEKEDDTDVFSRQEKSESKFDDALDKTMRHITVGTEFRLTKSLVFRFGYNYRRRQEMKIESKPGTTGFSWGVGLRISKFHISYGRSAYHLHGSPNYFSLSMNLTEFNRKL
ncbi:MAG: type IX secretion system protein PorQ [Bacteroidales bacterium]|nr:type IX secretion system protein PorQ [Bacteroidales bacterium]